MNISRETLARMAIQLEVDEVTTFGSIRDAIRFNVRVGDVITCGEVTERDCIFVKSIMDAVSRVLLDLARRARSQFEREQRMLSTDRLLRGPATDPKNYIGFLEYEPAMRSDPFMSVDSFELRTDKQTVRVINVSNNESKPADRFAAVIQEMEFFK